MSTGIERAATIVEHLEKATEAIALSLAELKQVRATMHHPAEQRGLHSVTTEISALALVQDSLSRQLSNWEAFLRARERS